MKRAGVSREALLSVRLDYESIVESIEGPRAVRELIWPKDYGSTTFGPPRWPQSSQLDSSDTGVPAHMASFSLTDNEGLLHQERAQLAQSKSNAAKSQTAKPNPARNVNTNNPEERRTKSAGLMKTESTQTEFDPVRFISEFATSGRLAEFRDQEQLLEELQWLAQAIAARRKFLHYLHLDTSTCVAKHQQS